MKWERLREASAPVQVRSTLLSISSRVWSVVRPCTSNSHQHGTSPRAIHEEPESGHRQSDSRTTLFNSNEAGSGKNKHQWEGLHKQDPNDTYIYFIPNLFLPLMPYNLLPPWPSIAGSGILNVICSGYIFPCLPSTLPHYFFSVRVTAHPCDQGLKLWVRHWPHCFSHIPHQCTPHPPFSRPRSKHFYLLASRRPYCLMVPACQQAVEPTMPTASREILLKHLNDFFPRVSIVLWIMSQLLTCGSEGVPPLPPSAYLISVTQVQKILGHSLGHLRLVLVQRPLCGCLPYLCLNLYHVTRSFQECSSQRGPLWPPSPHIHCLTMALGPCIDNSYLILSLFHQHNSPMRTLLCHLPPDLDPQWLRDQGLLTLNRKYLSMLFTDQHSKVPRSLAKACSQVHLWCLSILVFGFQLPLLFVFLITCQTLLSLLLSANSLERLLFSPSHCRWIWH